MRGCGVSGQTTSEVEGFSFFKQGILMFFAGFGGERVFLYVETCPTPSPRLCESFQMSGFPPMG